MPPLTILSVVNLYVVHVGRGRWVLVCPPSWFCRRRRGQEN
jgi:hypothetical protein